MKDTLKLLLVIFCGGTGAALPITGFYLIWHWIMAQVPINMAYAGLIKIGLTIGCLAIGGSATVVLAILGGLLAGALAVAILE